MIKENCHQQPASGVSKNYLPAGINYQLALTEDKLSQLAEVVLTNRYLGYQIGGRPLNSLYGRTSQWPPHVCNSDIFTFQRPLFSQFK